MDQKLVQILVCPCCKGMLTYHKKQNELWCNFDKLAFRIEAHIPNMLVEEARTLTQEECDQK